jgi:hypothetical protein
VKQIIGAVRTLLSYIPKKWRGTVFAVAVLGLATLAVLDHYNVGPAGGWIDQVARIAGIVAGVIALANLRDPGDDMPPAETESRYVYDDDALREVHSVTRWPRPDTK